MKSSSLLFAMIIATILNTPALATVNILVSTYDGLVIAADSRVTLTDSALVRIASDTYQKIFQVGVRTGVSCSGAAFLVSRDGHYRTIASVLSEFEAARMISDTSHVYPQVFAEDFKDHLLERFRSKETKTQSGQVELLVFGYDEKSMRRVFEITVPVIARTSDEHVVIDATVTEHFASGAPGSVIKGQRDVYFRLIKGYDYSLVGKKYFSDIKGDLDRLRYDVRYDWMSLQDAIDFAVFIVRATIEAQRFNQSSVMGVGGDIDVAVVTTDGFRWVQRKAITVEGKPLEP